MAIPVKPVGARAVLVEMEAHRTQLYAKALVSYRGGGQWWLPEVMKEQRELVNTRHTSQYELLNEKVERLPADPSSNLGRSDGGVGFG